MGTNLKFIAGAVFVLLHLAFVGGCAPDAQTLDMEISETPDSWGPHYRTGPSTNIFSLLDRVMSVNDPRERIRLSRSMRSKFWHEPEWFVERLEDRFMETQRFLLMGRSSANLIFGTNATPETVFAGWRIESELLDDLERITALTGPEWVEEKESERAKRRFFASQVRRRYEHYFMFKLPGCTASYNHLPLEQRPAFVEQVKRDFFGRKGMEKVDVHSLPKAFWE